MPSLSELIAHSTSRIECVDTQGQRSSGTGFFFNAFQTGGQSVPLLVTNKHVIDGAAEGSFSINTASNNEPVFGQYKQFRFSKFQSYWLPHPVLDLAVMPIGKVLQSMHDNGTPPYFAPISKDIIRSDEELKKLSAIEDITMVGYPNGIWDSVNNLPVIRRGITATPIYVDYNGGREFVIDAACFPGSSGSPVFILNEGAYSNRDSSISIGSRLIFVGILHSGPQATAQGDIVSVNIPTSVRAVTLSRVMMNLGYCIKASEVLDFENILQANGITPPVGYVSTPP